MEGDSSATYRMMDETIVAVAPSTVYWVLKTHGFFTRWNELPGSHKGTGFKQPLNPHDHWHVDISYLNLFGTFYYFMAVLDGCSRFIVHWDIRESMTNFIEMYNLKRLHSSLGFVTPYDKLTGRHEEILLRECYW